MGACSFCIASYPFSNFGLLKGGVVQPGDPSKKVQFNNTEKIYVTVSTQMRRERLPEAFACRTMKGLHKPNIFCNPREKVARKFESFDDIMVTQNSDCKSSPSLSLMND